MRVRQLWRQALSAPAADTARPFPKFDSKRPFPEHLTPPSTSEEEKSGLFDILGTLLQALSPEFRDVLTALNVVLAEDAKSYGTHPELRFHRETIWKIPSLVDQLSLENRQLNKIDQAFSQGDNFKGS